LSPPVVSGASGYSCHTEAVEAGVRDESRRSAMASRVVVTGMAGAGKSTFSRQLAAKTGLPLIHLDLHIWGPGWVRVPDDELIEIQRTLFAAQRWIVDSNDVDEDLLVAHADTLVVITTQWWVCSWRAFRRGLRRPAETQLPEGCEESFSQRIGDEWGIAWRNWRNRKTVPENDRRLAKRCSDLMDVHLLSNKQELADFLRRFPE
jgi:adenylate kinase family enzyme